MRSTLLEELKNKLGAQAVTSVERLEFEASRPTIVLEVTSPLRLASPIQDVAWAITKQMLVFWEPETLRRVPNSVARFRLSVNSVQIECSADVMLQLGYGLASREQWSADCLRGP